MAPVRQAEPNWHLTTVARSQALVADAREKISALAAQVASAKQHVAVTNALLERATAMYAVPFQYLVTAAAVDEPEVATEHPPRTFAAVTELIEQVERAALQDVDLAAQLTADIKRAISGETDAALLIAILLEGVAQTVLNRVPSEDQREMLIALCAVLSDRINQHGTRPD